ncbi:Dihydroorotate dehydrogenase (quinone), mitochondrial [Xylographa bjoerkii]|nr:Dihydroorotate dehydrogenase (quinone), mitochondrial [Xylographa bjoerkii]
MAVLTFQAGRIALRRAAHGKHQLLSAAKARQKSSATPTVNANSTTDDAKTIPTPDTVSALPLWQRLGPLSTGFNTYAKAQRKRPYVTQFCTSLVIYFCGDLAAQKIGKEEYNPWRTVRNIIIGVARFIYLGVSFNYRSKALSLATKVVVNQIVFTPIFNSYFFGMQTLLSGDGLASAWERIKQTVPISFINSWKLWPAVTAFSFTYIQPQYRAVFAGKTCLPWR